MNLDLFLFHCINHDLGADGLAPIMKALSNFRAFLPEVLVAVAWMLIKGGRRGRLTVLALLVIIPLSDQGSARLVKPLVHRARPCWPESGLTDVKTHGAYCPHNGSFPSSHALNTSAAAAILIGTYPVLAAPMAVLLVLVGWSRVYLGVHYPLDILGGWVLGGLFGGAAAWALRRWEAGRKTRAETAGSS
jgi:undecaprenyl-diphosphatase